MESTSFCGSARMGLVLSVYVSDEGGCIGPDADRVNAPAVHSSDASWNSPPRFARYQNLSRAPVMKLVSELLTYPLSRPPPAIEYVTPA